MPAHAASVLSDGIVTPANGTTATAFTFSVHYSSYDPVRPAQAVWADVAGTVVTLVKVSGAAHDGTWQGTATLPAGSWQVTFHASTSSDPQPEPLIGPIVTVTQAPSPTPTPTPTPTPRATAGLTPTPTPRLSTLTPTTLQPPLPAPDPPAPVPQPATAPTDRDDRSETPSRSPGAGGSAPAQPATPASDPSATAAEPSGPSGTPGPFEPAADEEPSPPASRLATLLFVGGTMSLVGAVVLARQWYVTHRA